MIQYDLKTRQFSHSQEIQGYPILWESHGYSL